MGINKFNLIIALITTVLFSGCVTQRNLRFANLDWHISDYYGQIIDRDTTYRMTFGNRLIPVSTPIISSMDSTHIFPGIDKYIADILHTTHLDSSEILFYAPEMHTMVVKIKERSPMPRPFSISSDLHDDTPYTMWVYKDNEEDWTRKEQEMYTYTYFNKKKQQILITDIYNYNNEVFAQIFIYQCPNRQTKKMGLPFHMTYFKHNLKNFNNDIEFWANQIDYHRKLAFANFKIGQEQAHELQQ